MDLEELVNLGKEDDSEYMEADREFFRQNPDQDFYVRKRFRGEMIPGNPPNVIVRTYYSISYEILGEKSILSTQSGKSISGLRLP